MARSNPILLLLLSTKEFGSCQSLLKIPCRNAPHGISAICMSLNGVFRMFVNQSFKQLKRKIKFQLILLTIQKGSHMKVRIGIVLAMVGLFLGGCASTPQQRVSLDGNNVSSNSGRIGVAMTVMPAPDTYWPGADCLLCYAVASAANTTLTTHTKTLSVEDLQKLKEEIAQLLQKKGAEVVMVSEAINPKDFPDSSLAGPNVAKKDFSELSKKHHIDKVVLIVISRLGVQRRYSSYIATSAPQAVVDGVGYMVNLKTNTYEWYLPVNVIQSSEGTWDEPPKFPGLTNAYFQAIEMSKDSFRKPFLN
jgi:hypothetical protein